MKLILQDNIKGRTIYKKVIPTVCKLESLREYFTNLHKDKELVGKVIEIKGNGMFEDTGLFKRARG